MVEVVAKGIDRRVWICEKLLEWNEAAIANIYKEVGGLGMNL